VARILITGSAQGFGRADRAAGRSQRYDVTELVYRHQLRPVIQTGATVMDRLFGVRNRAGP
jgi:hypothetical protein